MHAIRNAKLILNYKDKLRLRRIKYLNRIEISDSMPMFGSSKTPNQPISYLKKVKFLTRLGLYSDMKEQKALALSNCRKIIKEDLGCFLKTASKRKKVSYCYRLLYAFLNPNLPKDWTNFCLKKGQQTLHFASSYANKSGLSDVWQRHIYTFKKHILKRPTLERIIFECGLQADYCGLLKALESVISKIPSLKETKLLVPYEGEKQCISVTDSPSIFSLMTHMSIQNSSYASEILSNVTLLKKLRSITLFWWPTSGPESVELGSKLQSLESLRSMKLAIKTESYELIRCLFNSVTFPINLAKLKIDFPCRGVEHKDCLLIALVGEEAAESLISTLQMTEPNLFAKVASFFKSSCSKMGSKGKAPYTPEFKTFVSNCQNLQNLKKFRVDFGECTYFSINLFLLPILRTLRKLESLNILHDTNYLHYHTSSQVDLGSMLNLLAEAKAPLSKLKFQGVVLDMSNFQPLNSQMFKLQKLKAKNLVMHSPNMHFLVEMCSAPQGIFELDMIISTNEDLEKVLTCLKNVDSTSKLTVKGKLERGVTADKSVKSLERYLYNLQNPNLIMELSSRIEYSNKEKVLKEILAIKKPKRFLLTGVRTYLHFEKDKGIILPVFY